MATGDVTVFNTAKATMIDGDWTASSDVYVGIVDSGASPTPTSTATWANFSPDEVNTSVEYTAGGDSIGTIATCVTEDGGTMTFNSPLSDPTWAQNAGHSTDASWAIVYNHDTGDAICFVELGTVNMVTGALTISWDTAGIFSIADA